MWYERMTKTCLHVFIHFIQIFTMGNHFTIVIMTRSNAAGGTVNEERTCTICSWTINHVHAVPTM